MKNYIHPLNAHLHVNAIRNADLQKDDGQSFSNELQKAIEKPGHLKISKHAKARMEQRNIDISPKKWQQIGEKITEAKVKGVKEPLVLLENAALLVSAKNSTVITMMSRDEANGQIFNNIDGTIIVN
ncbi:flagellar operon protein [Bacillus freudenreichii]|nr:flagellar operon protein [Bacillus freudenreichii]